MNACREVAGLWHYPSPTLEICLKTPSTVVRKLLNTLFNIVKCFYHIIRSFFLKIKNCIHCQRGRADSRN